MIKKRTLGIALVALTIMVLGTTSLAAAQTWVLPDDFNPTYTPDINLSQHSIVWWFKTGDAIGSFNGRDVIRSSIVAVYGDEANNLIIIKPVLIILTQNYVFLVFCPKSLPTGVTTASVVFGRLTNGEQFFALGPGPAYRYG